MNGRQAPRLGRGLASLIPAPEPVIATYVGAPRPIPIELLEPSPLQARREITPETLGELADSIRENGILQPLLVRPSPLDPTRYQIIAGERRWRAAQMAKLHEIPALVRPLTDQQALAAGLVENLQRADLNAIEEAEGYQRLADEFGMTHEALALAVGKSRSHVGNTMRLLKLPTSVQRDLRSGMLSAGHARALLLHPDPAGAALAVVNQGLSVRQTEQMAAIAAAPAQRPDHPPVSAPEILDLQRQLTAHLGLRVALTWNGRKGRICIDVETLGQLEGVLHLLQPDAGDLTRL